MRAILAALLLALSATAFAQADEVAHPDPRVEQRLKNLGEELRCLVCQNETLAVSQAPLALDLRNEIRVLIRQGKTDDQIRAYLVARYGDFVLYKPPFKATTALLWLGPFALLALGIVLMIVILRRRKLAESAPPIATDERRQRIATLLESDNAQ